MSSIQIHPNTTTALTELSSELQQLSERLRVDCRQFSSLQDAQDAFQSLQTEMLHHMNSTAKLVRILLSSSQAEVPDFPSDEESIYLNFIDAVKSNDSATVETILLKYDTFMDKRDEFGWLPIHEAANRGYIETLRVLLDISNDRHINSRTGTGEDPDGGSVLWWAYEAGLSTDHPVVQLLISRGAVVSSPPDPLPDEEKENQIPDDAVERFLEAAQENDVDTLEEVMAEYPDVIFSRDVNGWQAFHEAAAAGNIQAVKFLMEHGADIHARTDPDRNGPNALWWALDSGLGEDDPVIHELWAAGAVPLAAGSKVAERGPPFSTIDFCIEDMYDAVVSEDCLALYEYASRRPEWLRVPDENGWLLLHEAARIGSIRCLTHMLNLLDYDPDFVNVRAGSTDRNALWLAKEALGEDDPVIEFLKSRGAVELDPLPYHDEDT